MKLNKLSRTWLFVCIPGWLFWLATFVVATILPRWQRISPSISNGLYVVGTIVGWLVSYLIVQAFIRS